MPNIFRKNIDPRCAYCKHGSLLADDDVICPKRGIVKSYESCRAFKYDPIKRTPPKPAKLSTNYTEEDMKI